MQFIQILKRISKASHIVALGALMMVFVACPKLDGVSRNGKRIYLEDRLVKQTADVTISFKQNDVVDGIAMYVDDKIITGLLLQNAIKDTGTFRVIDTETDEDIGWATFKDKNLISARIELYYSSDDIVVSYSIGETKANKTGQLLL